ncbi:hypothetical protein LY78DRAFT_474155 [Colletotrichum sublineola]|nr:hypothetical protein LY78DRAFT_474155 [Colletotrichum sublineola]
MISSCHAFRLIASHCIASLRFAIPCYGGWDDDWIDQKQKKTKKKKKTPGVLLHKKLSSRDDGSGVWPVRGLVLVLLFVMGFGWWELSRLRHGIRDIGESFSLSSTYFFITFFLNAFNSIVVWPWPCVSVIMAMLYISTSIRLRGGLVSPSLPFSFSYSFFFFFFFGFNVGCSSS